MSRSNGSETRGLIEQVDASKDLYLVNLGAEGIQLSLQVISVLLIVRVVARLHRHFPHPLQNILDLFMRPFGGVQQRLPVQCIANGLISAPNVSGKAGGNGDTRGIIGS